MLAENSPPPAVDVESPITPRPTLQTLPSSQAVAPYNQPPTCEVKSSSSPPSMRTANNPIIRTSQTSRQTLALFPPRIFQDQPLSSLATSLSFTHINQKPCLWKATTSQAIPNACHSPNATLLHQPSTSLIGTSASFLGFHTFSRHCYTRSHTSKSFSISDQPFLITLKRSASTPSMPNTWVVQECSNQPQAADLHVDLTFQNTVSSTGVHDGNRPAMTSSIVSSVDAQSARLDHAYVHVLESTLTPAWKLRVGSLLPKYVAVRGGVVVQILFVLSLQVGVHTWLVQMGECIPAYWGLFAAMEFVHVTSGVWGVSRFWNRFSSASLPLT